MIKEIAASCSSWQNRRHTSTSYNAIKHSLMCPSSWPCTWPSWPLVKHSSYSILGELWRHDMGPFPNGTWTYGRMDGAVLAVDHTIASCTQHAWPLCSRQPCSSDVNGDVINQALIIMTTYVIEDFDEWFLYNLFLLSRDCHRLWIVSIKL